MVLGPTAVTGGTAFSTVRVWGYDFTMGSSDALLTRLGAYDRGGDGIAGSLNLGVWDRSTENLVASTTISGSSNPLESSWRWANVGPVTLQAGIVYSFGITASITGDSLDLFNPLDISSFGTVGDTVRFASTTSGALVFPTNLGNDSGDRGFRPGINADLSGAAVPEPASLAMWSMMGGIGFVVRRKRKKA